MSNWKLLLVVCILQCSLGASDFKEHVQKDVEGLKYLQTPEDNRRLGLFSALFDMAQKREKPSGEIPKIMHFIWLGSQKFPKSSIENVKGWIDQHPGWRVKFWTDIGHAAPDDRMEIRSLDLFPLDELKENYLRSHNFGERSQILRYAILLREGGIYVDHDLVCLKSIEELQVAHDFFCGMEVLGPTTLTSSVNPSPHLLASTPQHPILKSAKKWLIDEWDRLETEHPGEDSSSIYNRVQQRAFNSLSVGVKQSYARAGRKDVVFPPDYFSLPNKKNALYAIHQHRGSWYEKWEDSQGSNWSYWLAIGGLIAVIGAGRLILKRQEKNNET